ncbi:MAG: ATP phosphoribosyltransferase regulatory subunit [Oscillospiraceae bacterium]|jgi:ATP phosphoribosyltransferase regulatory subunit|nr:ATP phosphoribosyltransferase regulatory subunit [Oscillospiraceae bacterium]
MKKYGLTTPEGTRDLLFGECTARRDIETKLTRLFKNHGFSEVITPFLEFYDLFDSSRRYFPQENMYKLTDAKGRLMVIRPDSTIPIIRLAETRLKDEPRPLKLCYCQTIYRVNPKEAGRDDEIAQCGIEIIIGGEGGEGGEGGYGESEALELAVKALELVGGGEVRFEIGHCGFFEQLARDNKINETEVDEIRRLVETKNYPELLAAGVPPDLRELPKLFGGEETFGKAEKLFGDKEMKKRLNSLKSAYDNLRRIAGGDKITVDLGLTNKRGYYIGTLFNGYTEGFGKPVLSGGVYKVNNTAAIGFAVNVSAAAANKGRLLSENIASGDAYAE